MKTSKKERSTKLLDAVFTTKELRGICIENGVKPGQNRWQSIANLISNFTYSGICNLAASHLQTR